MSAMALGPASQQPDPIAIARMETELLPATAPAEQPTSSRIGPYEIQGVMGKGGMGIVYRAKVVEAGIVPMGRTVALKMLSGNRLDPADRRRFEREAAYLQALRHPGIVRVLDLGEHQGRPYLVMQLVEGQTLDQVLRVLRRQGQQHFTDDLACDVGTQALEALHVAHLAGIVHRDLKPGNLMLTPDGAVKVLDFGMAHRLDGDSHLTATGSVLGTPAYMSPEQASGVRGAYGPRSDIYAMGAVLYELSTGQQPFNAENSMAILRLIVEGEIVPPSTIRPDLPRDLETVILKAMARDARDRYPSAEAMAEDLRRLRAGGRIRAKRLGGMILLARQVRRHRRTVAVVALLIFIVVMGSALALRKLAQHSAAREQEALTERQQREELERRRNPTWETIDTWPGIDWKGSGMPRGRNPLHDDSFTTLQLGMVDTHPWVELRVEELAAGSLLEILICDPDIGQGYTLRLARNAETGDSLILLRGGPGGEAGRPTEVSRVDQTFSLPLDLALRRDESGYLTASTNGNELLRFWDADPIEGPDNNKVWLVGQAEHCRLAAISLRKQSVPPYVGRLQRPDLMRQMRRRAGAISGYEDILKDPGADAEELRHARYRLALCYQEEESTLSKAVTLFEQVADSSYEDHKPYYIAATVQAWLCNLRRGDFDAAESCSNALFPEYDLAQVLVSVPRDTLKEIPEIYIRRGREAEQRERAVKLLDTATELAEHLAQWEKAIEAAGLAGDLLLGDGLVEGALQRYEQHLLLDEKLVPWKVRAAALLRLAEAKRFDQDYERSLDLYSQVMGMGNQKEELVQWARLWRGDLLWFLGDTTQARSTWERGGDTRHLPGVIMRALSDRKQLRPVSVDPAKHGARSNDIEYFNARMADMQKDQDTYQRLLHQMTQGSKTADWPHALGRQILAHLTTPSLD